MGPKRWFVSFTFLEMCLVTERMPLLIIVVMLLFSLALESFTLAIRFFLVLVLVLVEKDWSVLLGKGFALLGEFACSMLVLLCLLLVGSLKTSSVFDFVTIEREITLGVRAS